MAVVRGLGARGDDQRVVFEGGAVGERDAPRLRIDVDDFTHQDAGVLLAAQHGAQRRGDLAGGQRAGRALVQQRLKQVVIAAVDQRHVDGRGLQSPNREEAAEATADDDDSVSMAHRPAFAVANEG